MRAVDNAGRQSRWLRKGLHDFDFGFLRARPLWDIVVILLLAGVTAVCITGAWMSWLRIKLDFARLKPQGRGGSPTLTSSPPGLRDKPGDDDGGATRSGDRRYLY